MIFSAMQLSTLLPLSAICLAYDITLWPKCKRQKGQNGNVLPPREHQMLQAFLQNFANFITGQLLAAASGDVGGIRHGAEVGVGGDAKLCKAGRQTNTINERGQRVDTGGGCSYRA